MTDDEKKLKLAEHFIECILCNNGDAKADGVYDLYLIKNGDKEVLISHLEAVSSIMQDAIKLLKEEEKDE